MKQDYTYKTAKGHQITISRYGEEAFGTRPCVLYVHGFKGFKDWGFVPHMAQTLAASGLDVVTFNFSHNGINGHGESFSELKAFSQNTFSLELEETIEMIRLCAFSDFFGAHLLESLGLLGHSRGGGIALLAGQASKEVRAVCTWSSVSTFDRYSKQDMENWKKRGFHEVVNSRTGQVFKLGQDMLRDIQINARKKLHVLEAAKNLEKPLLVLHGQDDETVPYFEAEQINIFAQPDTSRLMLIPGGTHTFGAKHPFEGSTPALDQAIEATSAFFLRHLSP